MSSTGDHDHRVRGAVEQKNSLPMKTRAKPPGRKSRLRCSLERRCVLLRSKDMHAHAATLNGAPTLADDVCVHALLHEGRPDGLGPRLGQSHLGDVVGLRRALRMPLAHHRELGKRLQHTGDLADGVRDTHLDVDAVGLERDLPLQGLRQQVVQQEPPLLAAHGGLRLRDGHLVLLQGAGVEDEHAHLHAHALLAAAAHDTDGVRHPLRNHCGFHGLGAEMRELDPRGAVGLRRPLRVPLALEAKGRREGLEDPREAPYCLHV
mmetsp:Transcript_48780/g.135748  ORF Transcript_48780/g.135748 Transcript_48780/m.135748 type:complete len:263 (-) Transcript_48780:206-994(-)